MYCRRARLSAPADLHDAAEAGAARADVHLALEHAHRTRVYLLPYDRIVDPEAAVLDERFPARDALAAVVAVDDAFMALRFRMMVSAAVWCRHSSTMHGKTYKVLGVQPPDSIYFVKISVKRVDLLEMPGLHNRNCNAIVYADAVQFCKLERSSIGIRADLGNLNSVSKAC